MANKRQAIKGNNNTQAETIVYTTNNYSATEQEEVVDRGIVDEIFNSIISSIQDGQSNKEKGLTEVLLKSGKKIIKNFKTDADREEVKDYYKYAYLKISLIEENYQKIGIERGNDVQSDIHGYIHGLYIELKGKHDSSILILRELFKKLVPKGKEDNPLYVNIAKAFVLFFFDDCTIFEKTAEEKKQTKLEL